MEGITHIFAENFKQTVIPCIMQFLQLWNIPKSKGPSTLHTISTTIALPGAFISERFTVTESCRLRFKVKYFLTVKYLSTFLSVPKFKEDGT